MSMEALPLPLVVGKPSGTRLQLRPGSRVCSSSVTKHYISAFVHWRVCMYVCVNRANVQARAADQELLKRSYLVRSQRASLSEFHTTHYSVTQSPPTDSLPSP